MNLNLSGHHLEITPAIREYVVSKLERISRHFDHVIDVNVIMSVDKLNQKVEANVHLRGKDIHVESIEEDMYEPNPQSSVVEQANWIIQERIELMMILAVQALMHMSFDLNLPIEGHEYYRLLGDLHIGHVKCESSTKETVLQILAPAA